MSFTVLFDANALHPASQRDLLLRLAGAGLFRGCWTDEILDEMVDSILRLRPELADNLVRTRQRMCEAIPDCLVSGYEALIDALELPDLDDRHVLAAAIRCGAQVIVTNNIRDFPAEALDPYGVEAQTVDEFVLNLVELRPALVATCLQRQADALQLPPQTLEQLLARLENVGLSRTVAELRVHLKP